MIIPEDLTLEELIGVYKAKLQNELSTSSDTDSTEYYNLARLLYILVTIKKELDKKVDK